ncbi:MAG: metal-dependent transcriptional regulator [Methanomassiliicoccus sp.]|nr:metal-dependent transcriptional regulator [Methanomassiliicoccus sp.]
MVSENAEDYLACIYDLTREVGSVKTTAIAAKLDLTPASVTEMTQKLAAEGYLNYEKYKGVTLTSKGRKVAERIKRRHRLLERFLVDIVGMQKEQSHQEAMKLEHNVSDGTVEVINQILNYPTCCPDGDPIPPSDSIILHDPDLSMPLTDLSDGDRGKITHLASEDSAKIKRLISMGFVPGRTISVEERIPLGGPILVQMQEMKVALSRDYASKVMVRKCD